MINFQEEAEKIHQDALQQAIKLVNNDTVYQEIQKRAKILLQKQKEVNLIVTDYEQAIRQLLIERKNRLAPLTKRAEKTAAKIELWYERQRKRIRKKMNWATVKKKTLELQNQITYFHNLINQFLGQEVKLWYVFTKIDSNGKVIPTVYEILKPEEFKTVDISSEGKISVRFKNSQKWLNNINNAINVLDRINQSLQQETEEDYTLLNNTNAEVYKRFKNHPTKKGGLVLWIDPNTGDWTKKGWIIQSAGSINQIYTGWLLRHQQFVKKCESDNRPENNIQVFMSRTGQVTNLSGLLFGDESIKSGQLLNTSLESQLQIAIKSKGASTMGTHDLFQLAEEIVNNKINATEFNTILQKLKEKHQETAQKINISLEDAGEEIEKVIEKAFEKYLSEK